MSLGGDGPWSCSYLEESHSPLLCVLTQPAPWGSFGFCSECSYGPQKTCQPATLECDLFGIKVFKGVIQLRMVRWDHLVGCTLNLMTGILRRERGGSWEWDTKEKVLWRWRQRWESMMHLQAQDTMGCRQPPEERNEAQRVLPQSSRRNQSCHRLDFWHLVSRLWENKAIKFVLFVTSALDVNIASDGDHRCWQSTSCLNKIGKHCIKL